MDSNNYLIARYYTFCAIFQTIWAIAVLGFTIFLVIHFNNYWILFSLLLIILKPYKMLEIVKKDDKKEPRKSYGTNNPPTE